MCRSNLKKKKKKKKKASSLAGHLEHFGGVKSGKTLKKRQKISKMKKNKRFQTINIS